MPDYPINSNLLSDDVAVRPDGSLPVGEADRWKCRATTPQRKDHTVIMAGCLGRFQAAAKFLRPFPYAFSLAPNPFGVLSRTFSALSRTFSGPPHAGSTPAPARSRFLHRANSIHRIQPFGALVNAQRLANAATLRDTGSGRAAASREPTNGEQARVDFNRMGNGRLRFCSENLPLCAGWGSAEEREAALVQGPFIDRFNSVQELKEYVLTRWLAHIDGPTPPASELEGVRPLRLTGANPRAVMLDNVLEHVHQGGVAGFATFSVATDRVEAHGFMPIDPVIRVEIEPIDGGLRIFSVGEFARMHQLKNPREVEILTAPDGKCLAKTEIEFRLVLEKAGQDENGQDLYKCVLHADSAYTNIYDARIKDAFDDAFGVDLDLDKVEATQAGEVSASMDKTGLRKTDVKAAGLQLVAWMQSLVNSLLSWVYRLLGKEVEVVPPVAATPPATVLLPDKPEGDALRQWRATLPARAADPSVGG